MVFTHYIVPGGSDRSYGIHVAEMAGLPNPVVTRAREILHDLEGSARRVPVASGAAVIKVRQLTLLPDTHPALEALRLLQGRRALSARGPQQAGRSAASGQSMRHQALRALLWCSLAVALTGMALWIANPTRTRTGIAQHRGTGVTAALGPDTSVTQTFTAAENGLQADRGTG